MYLLPNSFHCKNPFLKKLQDDEAIVDLYRDSTRAPSKVFSHYCPLTKAKMTYSKFSFPVKKEVENADLGKRLLKDYFEATDLSLYSRKMWQREKLQEQFKEIEHPIDHIENKRRFQKEVQGRNTLIKSEMMGWEEEEPENFTEGEEEEDYDQENSEESQGSEKN